MSTFKVQHMIGFLAVLAFLGVPWLTYAQQQASTARKPIICWPLNVDMRSSWASPSPHALRETSDVYRGLYIRHLRGRGKTQIQRIPTKPEATIVSGSGSPV